MTIATDKEGFLVDYRQWSPAVAQQLAEQQGISLSPQHWEIIDAVRAYYQCYELSPAMRPLTRYLKQHLGEQQGSSIYLLQLFPGSPAKLASLIAGLPKPDNCL